MDHHKLRSAVFEKTGIKIDTTDPVFALVALNEAVLEEMFQRHLNLLQASHGVSAPASSLYRPPLTPDNWEQDDVAGEANKALASAAHDSAPTASTAAENDSVPAANDSGPAASKPAPAAASINAPLDKRLLTFATALGLAAALLVVVVQSLLTPGLSQEQKLQLQKAEKLRQAIDRLDPKLKAQLPAGTDKL